MVSPVGRAISPLPVWVLGSVRGPIPSPWSKRVQDPSCPHRELLGSSVWLSHAGPCWEAVVRHPGHPGVMWQQWVCAGRLGWLWGWHWPWSISRATPQGPPQCPPASSQGRPSPTISSARPCSTPCRPPGSPAFRSVFPLLMFTRLLWYFGHWAFLCSAEALPLGLLCCRNSWGVTAWRQRVLAARAVLSLQLPLPHPVPMAWLHWPPAWVLVAVSMEESLI